MTRAFPHTNFNSSPLVRLLADLDVAHASESRLDFAERLGQWLGVADAITLAAAHNAGTGSTGSKLVGAQSVTIVALQEEFAQVRTTLVKAITENGSFGSLSSFGIGGARAKPPTPQPGACIDTVADYRPYHRHYLARQRDMDSTIGPLRANARAILSKASPALRQLAILDAALDEILCGRERESLSTVPMMLEKRFEQLSKVHQQRRDDAAQADATTLQTPPQHAWQDLFCKELQEVLLAELDMRLQPVMGLIDAFSNEVNQHT